MADPVASVEKIVRLAFTIKEAVDTVRQNEEECQEIRKRVLRFIAILSQLQQTGMMNNNPAMSGALEDLEESLEHAVELVKECQERHVVRRFFTARDLSKQLRRVKDDISNKVMLASFAINAHGTIMLFTIHAAAHPPTWLQQDTGVPQISHNSDSSDDASRSESNGDKNHILSGRRAPYVPSLAALRTFSLSELKATIKDENFIGQGGACEVYKGVLKDGNVVVIKNFSKSTERTYDQFLVSKLQHKNIVKVLGYGESFMMRLKGKQGRAEGRKYIWVEEYMPKGSLDKILEEYRLDWSSLYHIIEGVAQGLHYLHEQGIIHLDVKPGNVLLDSYLNPKITDFELSAMLDDDETTPNRIMGTIGFISPEYVYDGIVSWKSDVYGFGVTVLETVNCMCKSSKPSREFPLYKWAWEAWQAGRVEELFDPSLFDSSQLMEIKRCMGIGFLCVQLDRADRPTMEEVIEMLNGDEELPTPKTLAYMKQDEGPDSPYAWSDGSTSP